MRLLIDANLSPRVAEGLRSAGYDAGHVADLDMVTATDEQIFDRGVAELAPEVHLDLLVRNLPTIAGDLRRGVIASLSPARLALRDLPLR